MAQANGRERADISSTVDQGTGEAEGKFEVVEELWQISPIPKEPWFFRKHVSESRDLVLRWKILMLALYFFIRCRVVVQRSWVQAPMRQVAQWGEDQSRMIFAVSLVDWPMVKLFPKQFI